MSSPLHPSCSALPKRYKHTGQYWSSWGRYEPCEWVTIVWAEFGDWLLVTKEGSDNEAKLVHRDSFDGVEIKKPNAKSEP